jgi:hypothetical protein
MDRGQSSRSQLSRWLSHLGIFFVSTIAAIATVRLLQPPKPKPTQVIYSVYLIRSDTPNADFKNEARDVLLGIKPTRSGTANWSLYGNMTVMGNLGAPATFSMQIPDSVSGSGTLRIEQLTVDLTATEANQGLRTKFGFLKGSTRTEHRFDLGEGDLRVIELTSVKTPPPNYFYALVQVKGVDPTPTLTKWPRPVTVPAKGMSK